jgi:hypothetical protein
MAAIRSLHVGDWPITNRDGRLPTGSCGDGFHAAAIVHVVLLAGCAALTVALPQRVPPGAGQPTV